MSDLISVIIPVYNIEQYLDRCLKSVTEQTYPSLQILLIDDGSTDNSLQHCNHWQKKDQRITVYHKENGGVSSARNLGIEKADGEWVIFIDGDDWIEPDMLQKMYACAIENQSDVAICSFVLEYGKKKEFTSVLRGEEALKVISGKQAVESIVNRQTQYEVGNSPCNKLIRRRIIEDQHLRFPVGRRMAEDMLFVTKAMLEVERCVLLSDTFYHYFLVREGNSSTKKFDMDLLRDDIELRVIRTKYLYQKEEKDLGDWSQDDLLYTLLIRYAVIADAFCKESSQLIYLRAMLKKHIKARNRKTKLGGLLYKWSPPLFVWVMKKYINHSQRRK